MSGNPTEELTTRLWDVLKGDLDQIPPSERERFIDIKRKVKEIDKNEQTRRYYRVVNLSNPKEAFMLEQIFQNAGFVQAHEESLHWKGDNVMYYVAMEVKNDLYRRLRKSYVDRGETPFHEKDSSQRPADVLKKGLSLVWREWVTNPIWQAMGW